MFQGQHLKYIHIFVTLYRTSGTVNESNMCLKGAKAPRKNLVSKSMLVALLSQSGLIQSI